MGCSASKVAPPLAVVPPMAAPPMKELPSRAADDDVSKESPGKHVKFTSGSDSPPIERPQPSDELDFDDASQFVEDDDEEEEVRHSSASFQSVAKSPNMTAMRILQAWTTLYDDHGEAAGSPRPSSPGSTDGGAMLGSPLFSRAPNRSQSCVGSNSPSHLRTPTPRVRRNSVGDLSQGGRAAHDPKYARRNSISKQPLNNLNILAASGTAVSPEVVRRAEDSFKDAFRPRSLSARQARSACRSHARHPAMTAARCAWPGMCSPHRRPQSSTRARSHPTDSDRRNSRRNLPTLPPLPPLPQPGAMEGAAACGAVCSARTRSCLPPRSSRRRICTAATRCRICRWALCWTTWMARAPAAKRARRRRRRRSRRARTTRATSLSTST